MNLNEKIIICSCNSLEHMVMFWYDEDPVDNALYVEIHLRTYRNFFKRLLYGLKYAFGHKSNYGSWDSFIFGQEEERKLYDILKKRHEK